MALFADEFAIEMDFAATVIGTLDVDEVPVNLALVAIVSAAFVGLAGGEVEAAGDFFIYRMSRMGCMISRLKPMANSPM